MQSRAVFYLSLSLISACGHLTPAADDVGSSGSPDPPGTGLTSAQGDGGPSCAADLGKDPKHCGWCGHDCRTGACSDGMCAGVTVAGSSQVEAIAVDEGRVY